jgi:hypothetical protein
VRAAQFWDHEKITSRIAEIEVFDSVDQKQNASAQMTSGGELAIADS